MSSDLTVTKASIPAASRNLNHLIRHLGNASARRPWRTIGAWAVLATVVAALTGAFGGAFLDDFTAPNSESAQAMQLLQERFPAAAGGSAVAVFAAPPGERVDNFRPEVKAALAQVARIGHVATVGDPFATDRVSTDGRVGYAEITLDVASTELGRPAAAAMAQALEPARAERADSRAGRRGRVPQRQEGLWRRGDRGVGCPRHPGRRLRDARRRRRADRSRPGRPSPSGSASIALLAGAMDVSTAAPTFGALIGLGVGIDYSLFIVSRYRENRAAGQANAQALSAAMGYVWHGGLLRRRDRHRLDGGPGADGRRLPHLHRLRHVDHRALRHGHGADTAACAAVADR